MTRYETAQYVATIIDGASEQGRTWQGRAWQGGQVVRVYLSRSGRDMGHLTIDDDGDVVGTSQVHGCHLAIAALDAAGVQSYA